MIQRIDEIQDDELRVIGRPSGTDNTGKRRKWLWWVVAGVLLAAAVVAIIIWIRRPDGGNVPGVFDPSTTITEGEPIVENVEPLGDYSDTTSKAYTEHLKLTINDIPLDVYIPHNAIPQLAIGTPDIFDKSIVLVTQAADIRADNGKINGAFVLAGQPMAWGLSKKGYVGIIDDKITVGVADNSPLFEEATEKGGYFFRQYPLVNNGELVENEPKGKAIRKAICDRAGEILVVMSESPESFHDFAQALVDLQVNNAVYLVGSDSYGYFRDKYDHFVQIYAKRRGGYKYENYIKWIIPKVN
jgi:hypothetical protein